MSSLDQTNLERNQPFQEEERLSFGRKIKTPAFWLTFVLLGIVWVILSGRLDSFHLSLGLISCLLVAYFSSDLLFEKRLSRADAPLVISYLTYLPWLLGQICVANWHVLKICLSTRMMEKIDPRLITFESSLKSDLSLVSLANSITLTPGTITVRVNAEGAFTVHAIDAKSGDLEALKEMESRVARAFGEDK